MSSISWTNIEPLQRSRPSRPLNPSSLTHRMRSAPQTCLQHASNLVPCGLSTFLGWRASKRRVARSVLSLDLPGLAPNWFNDDHTDTSASSGGLHYAHGPVGLQNLHLSPDLLDFLFEGLASSEADLHCLGFESCVDHPNLPGHRYLEAYFHTLPSGHGPVIAAHPRSGDSVAKAPAPVRLAAFAQQLRCQNAKVLGELAAACPPGSRLRAALAEGRAFGDLAVQIHWGDAVVDAEDVAWHVDAANSALHMAVSLHGRRTLQMRLRDPFELGSKVMEVPQRAGDVYIGNPAAYEHGLQYDSASWEDRIVASQLRLLLSEEELRDPQCLDGMEEVARKIGTAQPFKLPTLEDVRMAASLLVSESSS